jgi:hypothetical protein
MTTIILIGLGVVIGMYITTQIAEHIETRIRHKKFKENFEKYPELYPDPELLSECCGYKIIEGTDLCSNPECLEHTGVHNN